MAIAIDELLKKPFIERTHEEKVRIVASGKPRPVLFLCTLSTTWQNDSMIQQLCEFDLKMYDQVKWLTGCRLTQRIFCWPCLLFGLPGKWAEGITNFNYVMNNIQTHEKCKGHIEAIFKLHIFILENVSKSNLSQNLTLLDRARRNERVKLNRQALKILIDAICFAAKNQSSDDKQKGNLLKVKDCMIFLELLKKCKQVNSDVIDTATALLNKSPNMLHDTVDAIAKLIRGTIANEARASTFASLIVNEHVTSAEKSQISIVLRYIRHGKKVCERFIEFVNLVGSKWCLENFEKRIFNTIKDYGISKNFLALSINGTVLPKRLLDTFIKSTLRLRFQHSYFVPSTGFGYALLKSLSVFEECKLFFKAVDAIEVFFEDEMRFKQFEDFLCTLIVLDKSKWCKEMPFITMLSTYRKQFIKFFDSMVKHSEIWPADDIIKASSFRCCLAEMHNVFLLKTCHKLLADHFGRDLDFKNNTYGTFEQVSRLQSGAFKLRDRNGFEDIWVATTVDLVECTAPKSKKLKALNDPAKDVYARLFHNMVNRVMVEIHARLTDLKKLVFCDVMTCNSWCTPLFERSILSKLSPEQVPVFDLTELDSELVVIRGDPQTFAGKPVHDILEIFAEYNLREALPQSYKMAEFCLTLPYVPASKNQNASKLKKIRNYSYIPEVEISSGDISILCLEAELVQDLKGSENFYDDVIAKFSEVNRDVELHQM